MKIKAPYFLLSCACAITILLISCRKNEVSNPTYSLAKSLFTEEFSCQREIEKSARDYKTRAEAEEVVAGIYSGRTAQKLTDEVIKVTRTFDKNYTFVGHVTTRFANRDKSIGGASSFSEWHLMALYSDFAHEWRVVYSQARHFDGTRYTADNEVGGDNLYDAVERKRKESAGRIEKLLKELEKSEAK